MAAVNLKPQLRFPEFEENWEKEKLKNVSTYFNGGSFENDVQVEGKYELVTLKSVDMSGNLVHSKRFIDIEAEPLSKGTLVMILSEQAPGLLGMTALIPVDDKYVLNQRVAEIRPNEKVDSFFLSMAINRNQQYFSKQGAGTKVQNISKPNVENYEFFCPSLSEQTKIATFLTAVDERIAQLTKKKALLEQYKKGVMQKIFSQEIRFKDDNGKEFPEWKLKRLKVCIEQYNEISTKKNQFEVLTSSNKGLMYQKDYFGENRLTERDNIGFNIIPTGYLTFRSRSDNGRFTFNINNLEITGIISTYYPVFTIKNGSNRFFVEYLNFHWKTISVYSVGTSQRVLSMNSLCDIELKIPLEDEQTKIANFLLAIDKKIEGVDKQLEQTKLWKRGLLQQMFC